MQRINAHTVELTPSELQAYDCFNACLDDGHNIPLSVEMTKFVFAADNLSPVFWEYLAN